MLSESIEVGFLVVDGGFVGWYSDAVGSYVGMVVLGGAVVGS